jgi:MoaA/NifB/PqqE/SkfB family radical SAM enzyme
MKNALTYLTRACPRKCTYCALRESVGLGPELNTQEWCEVFTILEKMGIAFNLVLGNETWLLGERLKRLFAHNKVPYALYTTCPPSLFTKYRNILLDGGVIDNVSCGVDYPLLDTPIDDDSYWKSVDVWKGLKWVKAYYPNTDCQGTMTVHRGNYHFLPQIVKQLANLGIFCGINFIHWNKDGGFDFFPGREALQDFLFTKKDLPKLRTVLDTVLQKPGLVQNIEMLKVPVEILTGMGWHCMGNPYGGPTIDSDGSLRVCGYRKGTKTSNFSIFDLPGKLAEWEEAVYLDAMVCPGCSWSYPWMYKYWLDKDTSMGRNVFIKHAGDHIPKETWSKRSLK